MHDIFLLGKRFSELDLMIVQQLGIWNYDDRHRDAKSIQNRAGACVNSKFSIKYWTLISA